MSGCARRYRRADNWGVSLAQSRWSHSAQRQRLAKHSTTSATPQEGLGEILEASFERVELETVGSMAIFAATNPRTKPSTGMTT